MENIKSFSGRIDRAFSILLMCKNLLQDIIPDSDNEKARAHAAELVAILIKSAVDELMPQCVHSLPSRGAREEQARIGPAQAYLDRDSIIDSVDIDLQIERRLKRIVGAGS